MLEWFKTNNQMSTFCLLHKYAQKDFLKMLTSTATTFYTKNFLDKRISLCRQHFQIKLMYIDMRILLYGLENHIKRGYDMKYSIQGR